MIHRLECFCRLNCLRRCCTEPFFLVTWIVILGLQRGVIAERSGVTTHFPSTWTGFDSAFKCSRGFPWWSYMGQKSLLGNSLKRVELAVSCSRGFLCSKDTPLPTAHNEFITLVCTLFLPFFLGRISCWTLTVGEGIVHWSYSYFWLKIYSCVWIEVTVFLALVLMAASLNLVSTSYTQLTWNYFIRCNLLWNGRKRKKKIREKAILRTF